MRRFLLIVLFVGVLAGALLAWLWLPTGPSAETFVDINPGTSSRGIAALLQEHGIVRSQYAFDVLHLIRGGSLKAGEYRFAGPATMSQVYDRLRRGDVYTRSVTIPEGFNLFDVAQAVESAKLVPRDEFLKAAQDNVELIADLDPGAKNLEGYLFPDTYHFQRQQTPQQILAAMVKRFRETAALIGLQGNYHRVVTLASLVERETPVASDRPVVASVFENRLAKGMALMTDPTVIYAALLEKRYRGGIFQSDLHSDSAYNTYRHTGLPPGPICSPGVASLKAALSPAKTNYLYFVADPGAAGHSRFASSLEQHARNVQAYRQGLRAAQASR